MSMARSCTFKTALQIQFLSILHNFKPISKWKRMHEYVSWVCELYLLDWWYVKKTVFNKVYKIFMSLNVTIMLFLLNYYCQQLLCSAVHVLNCACIFAMKQNNVEHDIALA
jgi:hypothetical protein